MQGACEIKGMCDKNDSKELCEPCCYHSKEVGLECTMQPTTYQFACFGVQEFHKPVRLYSGEKRGEKKKKEEGK